MVNIKINGKELQVEEGITILEACRHLGIHIPTLCYLKDINGIGACRVCLVELIGSRKLVASCHTHVEEGMEILTNSPRVWEARRTNVALIISQHNDSCPSCVRSQNCQLQKLANDLNLSWAPYPKMLPKKKKWKDMPLLRDEAKCIKCARCIQICDKIQSLGVWQMVNTGARTTVGVSGNRTIDTAQCSLCGQCITHCPTGALQARDDTEKVYAALSNPDKIIVAQIAPAVRAAWGEDLGLSREEATVERLVAALRRIGFHYIFDTDFTADLTIMEEGTEFVGFLKKPEGHKFPLFTSCCPGWVRFLKSQYPDMVGQLSTAKSPQQMFGAVAKSYYAELLGVDPSRIFSLSIMPCTAKKHECAIPTMNDAGAGPDVDAVLTTREVVRMIKAEFVDVKALKDEAFDQPLGTASGAGVIFGATGGVMEAALRSAYFLVTGKNPPVDAFVSVRGQTMRGWNETNFEIAGTQIHTAIVSGLKNARKLVEAIRAGEVHYHFVEVMACPGGCAGGGGQPIHEGRELAGERGEVLYELDEKAPLRFSHENPEIIKAYQDYFGEPCSERAHHLLHTDHFAWEMPK